ncbi:16S rRNA (adenine(1518)-N(6)/adenine(1519)-N(6))-dimethyltransferase [Roseateles aquatilis]|uniref:Ribosomal RNA small subunit methyltransferase A n=1 Tax=Roseateles aquatilis TaxID=431061 RepID=A0A246J748_9BURK|nr:16S rRNA (adenine(1518)-N(6)/adenine(1519)-N(6))-dimethyltransferase RsmA [Roseateles aquatilis]OWQ88372.1 16S rRNA (adenine(1518)-N(6)/adenine(1519)-N(6))-dimethyltransferase [Roseateles aquatilis]
MGHVARKRFGQHFLTDRAVIDAIIDAIAPGDDQAMVEIGPGLGAMTLPLLQRLPASSQPLTVIELDRDLAARLRKRGDLTVVESDVLKVDFAALAAERGRKLRVVGNLPYNISSPILFHLLGFVNHVVDQTFMLQKEVVDRMAAGPGGKDYGRLSVMLQWRYQVEGLFDVPPEAFDPPPRVDSAIVRMVPHAVPVALDEALLSELVASAFSQRRKLLRHSLGRWLEARGFQGEFDLQRRAEEVPVAEFVKLAQSV